MELAKLAVMVAPNSPPHVALRKALDFYAEAVDFARPLTPGYVRTLGRLLVKDRRLESNPAWQELRRQSKARKEDTLTFDPAQSDDEARRFLAECGFSFKQPRTLLDNLRLYWEEVYSKGPFADDMRRHFRQYSKLCTSLGRPVRRIWPSNADEFIEYYAREGNGRIIYALPRDLLKAVACFHAARRSEAKRKAWKTRRASRQKESSV